MDFITRKDSTHISRLALPLSRHQLSRRHPLPFPAPREMLKEAPKEASAASVALYTASRCLFRCPFRCFLWDLFQPFFGTSWGAAERGSRRHQQRWEEAPKRQRNWTGKLEKQNWEVLYKILPLTIPGLAKQTCHFYTKFYFELYLITKLSISALIPELFGMSKKYFTKKRSFLQISNDFYAYYSK